MGLPVVTVAAGGLPVVEATLGTPVTEASNGRGAPVTKVAAFGLPVVFETTFVTFDVATAASVTLTTNNCIATNIGTTSANQGARVASTAGKTSGKYYFELQYTHTIGVGGANVGAGIGTTGSTYTALGGTATTGVILYNSSNIWANNVNTGVTLNAGTAFPVGAQYFFVAVDLDNRKVWFKFHPVGNWNNNASYNPATNVGGITIPAGTMVPVCVFGGTGGTANNSWGAAFGGTSFTGVVPAGFTPGWPA